MKRFTIALALISLVGVAAVLVSTRATAQGHQSLRATIRGF